MIVEKVSHKRPHQPISFCTNEANNIDLEDSGDETSYTSSGSSSDDQLIGMDISEQEDIWSSSSSEEEQDDGFTDNVQVTYRNGEYEQTVPLHVWLSREGDVMINNQELLHKYLKEISSKNNLL